MQLTREHGLFLVVVAAWDFSTPPSRRAPG